MAKLIFTNGHITVNSVDLSDQASSMTLNLIGDIPETTTFSETFKTRLPGLKDWNVDIEWAQNFAASKVDATLWPIWSGTVLVPIALRADAGATAATNPEYSGSVGLESYTPFAGTVGDHMKASTTFPGSGTLARATS